jgi:serine/threonine protein kinase
LLELCANGELFDYVKNKQFMPESLARFYFVQLLSAVQYMHKNGFIHGDIKLENILLDEEFNIKIADFGFSEQKGNREQRTSVMGTDGYFAPEQIQRLDHYG